MKIAVILAACPGGGIGLEGNIPWRLKEDMASFKEITCHTELSLGTRNAVMMGRKTWESIPEKFRPLKERLNVIVSTTLKDDDFMKYDNVLLFSDPTTALGNIRNEEDIEKLFICGGSSLYNEFLPDCDEIYFTKVLTEFKCDTFVDEALLPPHGFVLKSESDVKDEKGTLFKFMTYYRNEDQQQKGRDN
jgi:dihydrofolate reductase